MFKIMHVPKELRHLNYRELVDRQKSILEKTEEVLREAKENRKETAKIQINMLETLANLNKCSEEDLREIQLMSENYMKIAINKS